MGKVPEDMQTQAAIERAMQAHVKGASLEANGPTTFTVWTEHR